MSFKKLFILFISVVLSAYSLSTFAKAKEYPEVSDDGLHLVKDSKMAVVYAEPGADLGVYKRIVLLSPEVAFKKNWERDQKSRSASKLGGVNTKGIKKKLAKEFEAIFSETLTSGGYELVDESAEVAEDVLLIRPSIVNLDITAPEQHGSGRSNSYARSAGEMTLYIELFDSETGDLIAKAVDRRVDNENDVGFYTWTTSSSNKQAAKRILTGWADILLNALNEAKNTAPLPMPESD
jgi:hypothetical protein